MFSIGDKVAHPLHGAGVIAEIVREKINGTSREYYVFHMPMGGLVLKIPVASSLAVGLRPVMTCAEAECLLEELPFLATDMTSNWSRRYRENLERLKSGDLRQVAAVAKGLMWRERDRGLSTGERKMLHNARQILLSELVLAQEKECGDMEVRFERAMMEQAPQLSEC